MPKIAVLLDEDVWEGLAGALRQQDFDAVSVNEVGRKGFSDEEQMAFAVSQHRAILTHNVGDFISLAKTYFYRGENHYGVIIAPHLEKGELFRRTTGLLDSIEQAKLMNTIRFI